LLILRRGNSPELQKIPELWIPFPLVVCMKTSYWFNGNRFLSHLRTSCSAEAASSFRWRKMIECILAERIRLMTTRFAILVFVAVAFFTSGTPIQAQYSPLPRQCTDAYLEWYWFMVGQITIGKPYAVRMSDKLWFAQAMAAQGLTPAQIEMMWNMPAFWANFQVGWSNLSEWQKETVRRSWRLQIAGGTAYGTQPGFASGTSNVSPWYTRKSEPELRRQLHQQRR
jgi:hypothetical protein